MDKATMVSIDVSLGSELPGILGRAGLKINVALWMFLSEYEDWRLVIAGREFDSPDPRSAYRLVHDSVASAGGAAVLPTLLILPMHDPFIRELRRMFGKASVRVRRSPVCQWEPVRTVRARPADGGMMPASIGSSL